jgi:hypothetical protein
MNLLKDLKAVVKNWCANISRKWLKGKIFRKLKKNSKFKTILKFKTKKSWIAFLNWCYKIC